MNRRTKNDLENALKQLLKVRPLSKVTIKDLCEACNIYRVSFYYHFKDIYDLMEWSCLNDTKKSTSKSQCSSYLATRNASNF